VRSADAGPSRRALGACQQLGPYKERGCHRVRGYSNKRDVWQAGSALHGDSSSEGKRTCLRESPRVQAFLPWVDHRVKRILCHPGPCSSPGISRHVCARVIGGRMWDTGRPMATSGMSKRAEGVEGQGPRYKEGTVTLTHKSCASQACRGPNGALDGCTAGALAARPIGAILTTILNTTTNGTRRMACIVYSPSPVAADRNFSATRQGWSKGIGGVMPS